jgi:hypothetical protein
LYDIGKYHQALAIAFCRPIPYAVAGNKIKMSSEVNELIAKIEEFHKNNLQKEEVK